MVDFKDVKWRDNIQCNVLGVLLVVAWEVKNWTEVDSGTKLSKRQFETGNICPYGNLNFLSIITTAWTKRGQDTAGEFMVQIAFGKVPMRGQRFIRLWGTERLGAFLVENKRATPLLSATVLTVGDCSWPKNRLGNCKRCGHQTRLNYAVLQGVLFS